MTKITNTYKSERGEYMSTSNEDITRYSDEITYVAGRAKSEENITRYLCEEQKGEISIEEFISKIIALCNQYLDIMYEEEDTILSEEDMPTYVADLTGYPAELIEVVIWYYKCYRMANDCIEWVEECPCCDNNIFYEREAGDDMHNTHFECNECKQVFTFEELFVDEVEYEQLTLLPEEKDIPLRALNDEELKKIEHFNSLLPIQELEIIRKSKNKHIDILIDSIVYVTENADKLCKSKSKYFLHIYAIYLLAEFRERKAFPAIVGFIELDKKQFETLSHDIGVDTLASILACTYNGDQLRLHQVIENKEISEFARSAALTAYMILIQTQLISKAEFEQYLKDFIQTKLDAGPEDDPNSFLFITLITVIMKLNLYDLRHIVHELYENGYVDEWFVGDYADFIDELFKNHDIEDTLINDGIKKLLERIKFKNAKQYTPKKAKVAKAYASSKKDNEASNSDLPDYPHIAGANGLKGLSDFYDSETIEIDIAMYKALADNKSYNMFYNAMLSSFDNDFEAKIDKDDKLLEHFELAGKLLNAKAVKEKITDIYEYDKFHMIHYPLIYFFDEYFSLLYRQFKKTELSSYLLTSIEIIEKVLRTFTSDKKYKAYLKKS